MTREDCKDGMVGVSKSSGRMWEVVKVVLIPILTGLFVYVSMFARLQTKVEDLTSVVGSLKSNVADLSIALINHIDKGDRK